MELKKHLKNYTDNLTSDEIEYYKVKITASANEAMKEIYMYISQILKEENIAKNLQRKLEREILSLDFFPKRHEEVKIFTGKKFRRLIVKKYIVLYIVDKRTKIVYISDIYYGKMNYLFLNSY